MTLTNAVKKWAQMGFVNKCKFWMYSGVFKVDFPWVMLSFIFCTEVKGINYSMVLTELYCQAMKVSSSGSSFFGFSLPFFM